MCVCVCVCILRKLEKKVCFFKSHKFKKPKNEKKNLFQKTIFQTQ